MRDEESVFAEVLRCESPAARAAALDSACTDDGVLRRRVEALVAAHDKAQGILDVTPPGMTDSDADRTSAVEPVGTNVGPYKLLERIGEGGMGAVYMAEQERPVRRMVALKIIKPGMDSRQVVARFEAERQAVAMMDHPGIARVFDAGTTEAGRPYFAMELVKGVPITDYCDVNNLTAGERLPLFVQVCHAVQHAHTKGVIHRDLKPTNILVTLHDGVPVPKIIDFGIAKATGGAGQRLTDKTLFTHFAQMIGTPLYMSPEQAELSGLDVDTRSDVYSLGVLLYELLTGTTPFDRRRLGRAALDEVRRIIREEEPPRPSTRLNTLAGAVLTAVSANRRTDAAKLGRSVRGELDWIVMKALEKDRTRRYETADGMAKDVQRYLADEPVLACPPTSLYRFRKFARRNKPALATAAALALAAVVGVTALAVSTAAVSRANRELKKSVVREQATALKEKNEAYFQRITVAHRELSVDNLDAALRALDECPEDLRGWEWNYLARLCKVDPLVIEDGGAVYGVAFSFDGSLLAAACEDGSIKVRDSGTGEVIGIVPKAHNGAVLSVAFNRDGRHLASRGADRKLRVWDWTLGVLAFEQPCDTIRKFGSSCTVAFSPNGRQLAFGIDGAVTVWDWKEGRPLRRFAGHRKNTINLAYSSDGLRLASACTGEGVMLWDPNADRPALRTLSGSPHPLSGLAFGPNGEWLASACLDNKVRLWDVSSDAPPRTMAHTGPAECVAVSPDGLRVASVGEDKAVRVWEATTGREVLTLRDHTGRCGSVAFSPDEHGWRLATASTDGTIRIWNATPLRADERQEAFTYTGHHDDEIRKVAVSRDGNKVASAGQGSAVKIWHPTTGEQLADIDFHTHVNFSVDWHPHLERIAAAGWDGEQHLVQVRDAQSGAELITIRPGSQNPAEAFYGVAFSPDGRFLVTGNGFGEVQVWEAGTGKSLGTLGKVPHESAIRGAVFSRNGKYLASASSDGEVRLWDATRLGAGRDQLAEQAPLHSPKGRVPGATLNVAFSPDEKRIAIGGEDSTITIWDVQTGELLQTLPGLVGDVYALAFSPDEEGRWIAAAGENSTVKIWDTWTGEMVRRFRGHRGVVASVAFSPDGRLLYSGSRDRTVKGWDLTALHAAASATRPTR